MVDQNPQDQNRIDVEVEGDGVYVFEGPDAEDLHDRWALDGAETFTRIER